MACEAIKGLLITTDIPMAQFIVNLNANTPNAQKFILEVLDDTHIFVLASMAETEIQSAGIQRLEHLREAARLRIPWNPTGFAQVCC